MSGPGKITLKTTVPTTQPKDASSPELGKHAVEKSLTPGKAFKAVMKAIADPKSLFENKIKKEEKQQALKLVSVYIPEKDTQAKKQLNKLNAQQLGKLNDKVLNSKNLFDGLKQKEDFINILKAKVPQGSDRKLMLGDVEGMLKKGSLIGYLNQKMGEQSDPSKKKNIEKFRDALLQVKNPVELQVVLNGLLSKTETSEKSKSSPKTKKLTSRETQAKPAAPSERPGKLEQGKISYEHPKEALQGPNKPLLHESTLHTKDEVKELLKELDKYIAQKNTPSPEVLKALKKFENVRATARDPKRSDQEKRNALLNAAKDLATAIANLNTPIPPAAAPTPTIEHRSKLIAVKIPQESNQKQDPSVSNKKNQKEPRPAIRNKGKSTIDIATETAGATPQMAVKTHVAIGTAGNVPQKQRAIVQIPRRVATTANPKPKEDLEAAAKKEPRPAIRNKGKSTIDIATETAGATPQMAVKTHVAIGTAGNVPQKQRAILQIPRRVATTADPKPKEDLEAAAKKLSEAVEGLNEALETPALQDMKEAEQKLQALLDQIKKQS